jgi:FMN phosphatase YigB (HAD superfamily)
MITLFLDFDDTLFDSARFKQDLMPIFKKHGAVAKRVEETYASLRSNYSPCAHATLLWKNKVPPGFINDITALLAASPKYLHKDALPFLKNLNREGYRPVYLTLGEPTFQIQKITGAGIEKYAAQIEVCQDDKWKVINNLLPENSRFILIDDRADTIIMTARFHPHSYGIIVNRSQTERVGRYPLFQVVHSLSELHGNQLRKPYPDMLI